MAYENGQEGVVCVEFDLAYSSVKVLSACAWPQRKTYLDSR